MNIICYVPFFLVVDNILRHHISPLGRGHFNKILRHWWPYVLSRLPVVPVSKLILITFNDDTELDWRPSAVVDDQFLLKNFSGGGGGVEGEREVTEVYNTKFQ